MSDDSRTLPAAPAVDRQADRDALLCLPIGSMTTSLGTQGRYLPLSERTCDQLLARSEELRRMAETATTTDVARALATLADRYAALAAKRRMEEVSFT